MKRKLILISIALFLIIGIVLNCTYVKKDPDRQQFIDNYLPAYEVLVDLVLDHKYVEEDKNEGLYILHYDRDIDRITRLIYWDQHEDTEITDEEIISALNTVRESMYFSIETIKEDDTRILFLASEGTEGIIYMKSNRRPRYFISEDSKYEHYSLSKLCSHWYRAKMWVR
ncbi:MAG: hypothetical protein KBT01_10175 [Clostridiales bacterium]|nr:hypothetical protein [Candidatus Blautia equi]